MALSLTAVSSAPSTSRPKSTTGRRIAWSAYLYLLPAFAFYLAFMIWPIGQSIWISLFDWDGTTLARWVGLGNYREALADPRIWEAVRHSFAFVVFYAVLPIALGLFVVGIVARIRVRALTFFRAALFLPYTLSTVVVAVAWRWMYAPDGPVNAILEAIGMGSLTRAWLGDFDTALPAVGFIGTWIMVPLAFVLFLAGAQRIPLELYEAARIDGAGAIREFFVVTLPALRGEMRVATILMVTGALRNFDIVWNTTTGGPGTTTTVPSYFVYQQGFIARNVGMASTIAILLTILILAVVAVVMWLQRESRGR